MFTYLVRNAQARPLIEYFCTASVTAIFFIRIFLYITGYPQLGGAGLHIAHMLWGGLLMSVAILLMVTFLNRGIKVAGAVIGGIGFGTFIDELGKFLTHDNDYFFQPTILLLYLIFVGLFFLAKQIEVWFPLDKEEYLVNSLELLKEVAAQDLDSAEKQQALDFLKKAATNEKLETVLIQTFNQVEPLPIRKDPVWISGTRWLDGAYKKLVSNTFFAKIVIVVFFLASIDNFAYVLFPEGRISGFLELGMTVATLLSLYFIVQGAYFFKKGKRLAAFESLKIATLVSIFLVQLFLFYIQQLPAAVELLGAIISLQVLQFAIDRERALQAKKATQPAPSL